jgi:hypothetical protein
MTPSQIQKKYANSEKGKKKIKAYNSSEKGREMVKKSNHSLSVRWNRSRYSANKKGVSFTLTFIEYCEEIAKPCFYCNEYFQKRSTTGIGLDRVDNEKGYDLNNVVSCCCLCNMTKSNWISAQEMVAIVNLIKSMRSGDA